jgi:hypothetical protein
MERIPLISRTSSHKDIFLHRPDLDKSFRGDDTFCRGLCLAKRLVHHLFRYKDIHGGAKKLVLETNEIDAECVLMWKL